MISLNKIIQAKRTISGFVYKTPFAYSAKLSLASGALIYLKEENLQRTGAYKIRGAYNKIANLSGECEPELVFEADVEVAFVSNLRPAKMSEEIVDFLSSYCS